MENKLFCGDNLTFLTQYKDTYKGKIKLIYIDPPYNTKNNHFIFKDNLDSNDWLSFMKERLEHALDLLRDDGAIFISIDDSEYAYLKILCDNIFGRKNFVSSIVWERTYSRANQPRFFSRAHEYILCYAKNKKKFIINQLPRTQKQDKAYKNLDGDPRGPWRSDDITVRSYKASNVFPIFGPTGKAFFPTKGCSWAFSQKKMQELLEDKRVWFGRDNNSQPRYKRFLSDVKGSITPKTIWTYDDVGHTNQAAVDLRKIFEGEKVFDFSKPVSLIKRIIYISTKDDDIVLDFFAGSGTTAQAVVEQNAEDDGNRSFILVQLPEEIGEDNYESSLEYKNVYDICKARVEKTCGNCFEEVIM